MISISFDTAAYRQIQSNCYAVDRYLKSRLMRDQIAGKALEGIRENFNRERSGKGVKWKKRSPKSRFGRAGGKTLQDTKTLFRSLRAAVVGDRIVITSDDPSAEVHNYGATITPKNGEFLAIPLIEAVQDALKGEGIREAFPTAFVLTTAAGKKFIVRRDGSNGLEFLALLRESVTIPARPFMDDLPKSGWKAITDMLAAETESRWENSQRGRS